MEVSIDDPQRHRRRCAVGADVNNRGTMQQRTHTRNEPLELGAMRTLTNAKIYHRGVPHYQTNDPSILLVSRLNFHPNTILWSATVSYVSRLLVLYYVMAEVEQSTEPQSRQVLYCGGKLPRHPSSITQSSHAI